MKKRLYELDLSTPKKNIERIIRSIYRRGFVSCVFKQVCGQHFIKLTLSPSAKKQKRNMKKFSSGATFFRGEYEDFYITSKLNASFPYEYYQVTRDAYQGTARYEFEDCLLFVIKKREPLSVDGWLNQFQTASKAQNELLRAETLANMRTEFLRDLVNGQVDSDFIEALNSRKQSDNPSVVTEENVENAEKAKKTVPNCPVPLTYFFLDPQSEPKSKN